MSELQSIRRRLERRLIDPVTFAQCAYGDLAYLLDWIETHAPDPAGLRRAPLRAPRLKDAVEQRDDGHLYLRVATKPN